MGVRSAWALVLVGVVGGAGWMGAACGGTGDGSGFGNADDAGGVDGSFVDDGGTLFSDGPPSFGDGATGKKLVIDPPNPVLDVNGPGVTQAFKALVQGQAVTANWSIDNIAIGTIDNAGLFKAAGAVGGIATVSATSGNLSGSTTVTVRLHITENPGNVDANTQTILKGGGTADAAFKWLYPYDQTVFPRGLLPPTLQFAGAAPTATYVHITSKYLDYQGFFGASSPARVPLSAALWTTLTKSAAASDPVTVKVTKSTGGQVTGPVSETWNIAQGSLKGTVYYNTYDSPLNNGRGAVMRIKPGSNADIFSGQQACTVCHSVSADGSTLISLGSNQTGLSDTDYYKFGTAFDLKANGAVVRSEPTSYFGFSALTPDGSLVLSCGAMGGNWPPNIPGLGDLDVPAGDRPSKLLDPRTGAIVAAPGWDGVVSHAIMPAFSPDGKKIVFNHFDVGQGHSLSVMDFVQSTKTFSNLTEIHRDASLFLGWPAFTPDSKSFIYNTVDYGDYATWTQYGALPQHHGDLFIADVASKAVTPLDLANGFSNGATYLPNGTDPHLNYEPTMLPVAVGGYYWVVFTSRRTLGNIITDADPFKAGPATRKKLWVAAIEINPVPGKDASHPAFYLEGQELGAGNMRGFWALDPCKQNGNDCTSGDECCGGFCRQVNGSDGGSSFVCVPPPAGCAQEFEKCTTAADCCGVNDGYLCINGHCAKPAPR